MNGAVRGGNVVSNNTVADLKLIFERTNTYKINKNIS